MWTHPRVVRDGIGRVSPMQRMAEHLGAMSRTGRTSQRLGAVSPTQRMWQRLCVVSRTQCMLQRLLAFPAYWALLALMLLILVSRPITVLANTAAGLEKAAGQAHRGDPSSLEALKYYNMAVRLQRENGGPPVIPLLERAIKLDPGFPLPYAMLSTIYGNLRQPALALQYSTRAYQLRGRLRGREKLRITAAYYLASGQLQNEMQTYKLWQRQYPRDFIAYNDLGNDYAATGRLNEALAEYQKGLQLEPTQIGYVNVGGMYISLNRLDEAKAIFEEALAHNFDGRFVRQSLYWLAFLQRDPPQMRQQLTWASAHPKDEDALLTEQSDTEAYFGRIGSARDFTKRAVSAAIRAGAKETAALWEVNDALREAEIGNASLAKQEVSTALALSSDRDVTLMSSFVLARSGAAHEADALVEKLQREYSTDALLRLYWLPNIHAALALSEGNPSRAIKELKAAEPYELGGAGSFVNYLYPAYLRGQAYLLAHRGDSAAVQFRKLIDHPGVVVNFVTGALAHLQIGRAYAQAGKTASAIAAYEAFFELWKGADPDVPILKEAKAEYAEL